MSDPTRDTAVEYKTLFEDFARWVFALSMLFGIVYVAIALHTGAARMWLGVGLDESAAVVAWASLRRSRAGQLEQAAGWLGYELLAVAVLGALVVPYTYPTLAVLPLLGFAAVLPYLRGHRLQLFVIASLSSIVVVITLGVLFQGMDEMDPELTHGLLIITTTASAYLAMRLLYQYGESLRTLLEKTQAANAELSRANGALRVSEERATTLARSVEDASRAKDEFLATVSHELRTPLTSIGGWTQLLRAGKLGAKDSAHGLEVIDRNSRTLARLVDDVLDVSRIISGRLRLEVNAVDVSATITHAVDSLRPAADAKHQLFTIESHTLSSEGDPLVVSGDPARLQQVIWNLLSNAIKFTPDGGRVTLRVGSASRRLLVEVEDTGTGIDAANLPHLFERFWQADPSTTRRQGGLGLGLAIVRHLVELHGGTVTVQSPGLGKGSTFRVELPLGVPLSLQASPSTRYQQGGTSLTGLQVLVVDDEADTRDLIASVISRWGARVREAGSAREALASLGRERADILVCDLAMPDEDGLQLIGKLRDQGSRVPALAITAFADASHRDDALKAGFDAYLSKPVDNRELITVVSQLAAMTEGRARA